MLGSTYADGITQTLLNVIGGLPMGIGIFLVWPLSKRFGKKTVTATGFILCTIGDIICFLNPSNLVVVLIGQFILNMGIVPAAYVFPALMASVFDELEYKCGYRCDGVAASVINSMNTIAVGLSIGIFNLLIQGYVQPEFDALGNCITTQPTSVLKAIVWAFVGMNVFIHGGLAILLRFLDIEIKMPHIQRIIRQRQMEDCKARGEEWIEPTEKARLVQEELDLQALESFKSELAEKCKKNKKLNYDNELAKYIEKTEKLKAKASVKEEKRLKDEAEFMHRMEERAKRKGMEI
ncbi:MAG: MFS transporter [Eubacterium sp.]